MYIKHIFRYTLYIVYNINTGAVVDGVDSDGRSPLSLACENGLTAIAGVYLLIIKTSGLFYQGCSTTCLFTYLYIYLFTYIYLSFYPRYLCHVKTK